MGGNHEGEHLGPATNKNLKEGEGGIFGLSTIARDSVKQGSVK